MFSSCETQSATTGPQIGLKLYLFKLKNLNHKRRKERGGGAEGGQPSPRNNLRGGGGATYPLPPPPHNNPPTFSFNFYVKQEKTTNVRS